MEINSLNIFYLIGLAEMAMAAAAAAAAAAISSHQQPSAAPSQPASRPGRQAGSQPARQQQQQQILNSPETDIFHFVLAADNAPDRKDRR